jgi:hypothetical protein
MVNRKLIRPSLSDIKDQMPRYGPVPRKKVPPEVTNAADGRQNPDDRKAD